MYSLNVRRMVSSRLYSLVPRWYTECYIVVMNNGFGERVLYEEMFPSNANFVLLRDNSSCNTETS